MLKTLMKQLKEYRRDSVLTPCFMVLEVVMEMIIPLMMASIIDDGVEVGNLNHIYKMGFYMVIAAGIGLAAGILGGKYGARASAGFARNLRKGMYENIQTFSFANIDKFSTAGLVTRMTTDVTNIQNAYQMILRMCIRALFSLICAMFMSFFISPRLASIYLAAVLVLGCILAVIISFATKYFNQVFPKYDDLNESVQENVSAIRVVKAFVREDYERQRFTKASGNLYRMFVKAETIVSLNAPVMMATVYTCILLISWVGAKMIVSSTLATGELMSLFTYCMNILMSLMMLSMVFVMISMSTASAERIAEVLEEKSTLTNPENPDMEVTDGSITFDHVNFSYHEGAEEWVLKDIHLDIRSGETIGIIGGTGSAKTSLANLVSRIYDVSEGAVRVGGKDVRSYDLETLRNQVAVVLQKNVLFSGTILENLRWGDGNATREECIHACRLACADDFIESFPEGYDTYIEQGGTNVSGGQKQRICIARALLKKPKILILDDSTSAVDTATDAKIRRAFKEEIPGTTKLIIAQRISSVEDADRIIVMEDGEINGFGTHEELLAGNAIYRDIYESQTGGSGDFDEAGGVG
ncbi:MAG: ABC transporter ATP-binding protein/permease [Bacteroidales bacterium]|nr:ABC transporter ATP-binding protein/permease [Clostridium sp.]MCM1203907.1 ABC transporter ATP-binding protein/permease [Bacteroidales bacterium]